jgi:hypothetical protein
MKIKKKHSLLLVWLFPIFLGVGVVSCDTGEVPPPYIEEEVEEKDTDTSKGRSNLKILAIGNSFSDDAVEHYLDKLAHANGDTIVIGNMYIGGCTLELHANNAKNDAAAYSYRKIVNGTKTTTPSYKLIDAIKDEKWDFISLQQVSQLSGVYDSYFPYIEELIAYVKKNATNPDMEIIFHSTWAYAQDATHSGFANYQRNQQTMYQKIVDASTRAAQRVGIQTVVPAGTAIQNGRTSVLGDTFCRDGYHLELGYGRYTASCVWYEMLFQKSVIGNNYFPAGITRFQAKIAQHAASYAAQEPLKVTSLASLIDDTPVVDFNKKINISFAGEPDVPQWNLLSGVTARIDQLRDIDGGITNVSLQVVDRFGGINGNGPTSTTTAMNLPSGVTSSSFFGNTVLFSGGTYPKSKIRFCSLSTGKGYTFSVFSSRMSSSDNRETYYSFSGAVEADTILYLNASNNTTSIVKALNIKPDSQGAITIEVGPAPSNNNPYGFFYITAMSVEPE